jgi:hypothetical protein
VWRRCSTACYMTAPQPHHHYWTVAYKAGVDTNKPTKPPTLGASGEARALVFSTPALPSSAGRVANERMALQPPSWLLGAVLPSASGGKAGPCPSSTSAAGGTAGAVSWTTKECAAPVLCIMRPKIQADLPREMLWGTGNVSPEVQLLHWDERNI